MSTIEMIEAAAKRLKGHVRETPILSSPFLDAIAARRIWVKPEFLQHTGSFKFRGLGLPYPRWTKTYASAA